jgi:hypothetical protein
MKEAIDRSGAELWLEEVAAGKVSVTGKERIEVIRLLLDRGYGKALDRQVVADLTPQVEGDQLPLELYDEEELMAAFALERRINAKRDALLDGGDFREAIEHLPLPSLALPPASTVTLKPGVIEAALTAEPAREQQTPVAERRSCIERYTSTR